MSTIDAINWVKNYNCNSSPRLHCNHSPEETYNFMTSILLEDLKLKVNQVRRDLIKEMQRADKKNDDLYYQILAYHNEGEDQDSVPNLGGIMYQPWY